MTIRRITIPLSPEPWAVLEIDTPLSPAQWEQLVRILEAFRPGLVDALAGTPAGSQAARGENALPTTESLSGSDPDFTGGRSLQEHMDRLRGRGFGEDE